MKASTGRLTKGGGRVRQYERQRERRGIEEGWKGKDRGDGGI